MTGGRPHRPLPSLRFRRIRALILLVVLITVISFSVHLARGGPAALADGSSDQPAGAQPAAPAPTSESAAAELGLTLAQRNTGVRGRLSVAVTDLGTGVSATYGAPDGTFITASIVKVDILATLLLQREGQLTKSQRTAAQRMIQRSDNGAATTLWRQIGKAKGLQAANQQFGLTSTVGGKGGRWGTTTTTAADQLQLLRVVFAEDSPLNATSRTYLQKLMSSVAADQDWGISAADTRPGTDFHVKNGWLPRSKGWVVNSIGAVQHQGHRLLIVVLSDGRPVKNTGIQLVEGAAQDTAKAVTGV
jgi:beta-lactamase class A